jgi:hypothetical protein
VSGYETEDKKVMGTDTMWRAIVAARIENLGHIVMVERVFLPAHQVSCIEVSDAIVDCSFSILLLTCRASVSLATPLTVANR